jgi:ATP-dependent DNA ligase
MSADKRSFTGFKNFPGKINHDINLYEFPTLFKVTDNNKIRQWTIFIRLIKEESKNIKETKKQNWNLLSEIEVPIKDEYLSDDSKLSDGIISQIWTETGLVNEHISRSAASYPKAKNVGRANERNCFHQALSEARSKYLKKINEGSVLKKDLKQQNFVQESLGLYFPMLARQYADYIEKDKIAIKYPLYVQPKLDGSRLIAFLDCKDSKDLNNMEYTDVILYTRQKKLYPESDTNNKIRKCLLKILKKYYDIKHNKSLYFDGEIYSHGMSLQDIGSETRATKSDVDIQYWLYDCFYPFWKKEPFSQRIEFLENAYNEFDENEKKYIILTPTHLVKTEKENDKLFNKYLNEKYEGIMIRNALGIYAKSATSKSTILRSKDLLKRKRVFDSEFEVVDFTEGKSGTSKSAVIWICITKDGKKFKVTPNMSNDERYKIYKECISDKGEKFIKKYKNRLLIVEYRSLTNSGIPSHAKSIGFKDYE